MIVFSLFACSSNDGSASQLETNDAPVSNPAQALDDSAEDSSGTTEPAEDIAYGDFRWPDSDIASLLPVPKSNLGDLQWDSAEGFQLDVAQTTFDDFCDYISQCKEMGFTENHIGYDDYYYAYNADGYYLGLKFLGNDVMYIRIDDPMDK